MKSPGKLNGSQQKEVLIRIAAWRQAPASDVACPVCSTTGLSIIDQSARPFVEWYALSCKACGLSEMLQLVMPTPARILGLASKGHLGPGADADITIYTPHENKQIMFELPRYVIKAGQVIVEQGEVREPVQGKTLHVAPDYDRDVEADIAQWFEQYYSIRFRNYAVGDEYLHEHEAVACG